MHLMGFRNTLCASLLVVAFVTAVTGQRPKARTAASIPTNILLRIIRAEDQRRWDDNLKSLLTDKDPKVRKRAALAAGRIGDERAVPALIELLKGDADNVVRQMAAFAIGEIESPAGADALIDALGYGTARGSERVGGDIRGRAVEALGKISDALPEADKDRRRIYGAAILDTLRFEAGRRSRPATLTILLGLTAVLRAKPERAGSAVVPFLGYSDPRIIADALNTMARLRLKDNNEEVRALLRHSDPIVRANAARVIGAAEDKGAFEALLDRALLDEDLRVRVSAIRALGSLKDVRAVEPLLARGARLISDFRAEKERKIAPPTTQNELLEVAGALGRVTPPLKAFAQQPSEKASVMFFINARRLVNNSAPEVEIGFARMAPEDYMTMHFHNPTFNHNETELARARRVSSLAEGLREIAALKPEKDPSRVNEVRSMAETSLASWLCVFPESRTRECSESLWLRQPEVLRAYAAFKPKDLSEVLRQQFRRNDVIIRATAAELLGELPPDKANERALIAALPNALRDKDLNDAALAILDALGKQKSAVANEAIKTALDSSDHLIRRKAVALLKANGVGDFSNRIGYVQTRNTEADYRRAINRIGKKVTATVVTSKGSFIIEFLPEDAPLTVDNFVMLARRGYFNGQTVPRVVPNFVIQTGDPRGDQNGGPGYSIRCEINEVPYDRAAVGMALSGKDTGGSQWFVTHSPQPHLDGGYTVFGRVVSGMDVVDRIARGDTIRRVIVNER
jgi:cyclophilin family peptidyl-prolyl cis-trans isomerase/HEAT repeat protein